MDARQTKTSLKMLLYFFPQRNTSFLHINESLLKSNQCKPQNLTFCVECVISVLLVSNVMFENYYADTGTGFLLSSVTFYNCLLQIVLGIKYVGLLHQGYVRNTYKIFSANPVTFLSAATQIKISNGTCFILNRDLVYWVIIRTT